VYFPRRVIPMLPEKLSQRPVFAQPGCGPPEHGVRHGRGTPDGEIEAYQFYPAVIIRTRASPTPRWRPSWPTRAGPRRAARVTSCRTWCTCMRSTRCC
jgi:hypothetical protein